MQENSPNTSVAEEQKLQTNELYDVREDAIKALIPNLEKSSDLEPTRKFDIYLSALQQLGDPKIARQAFEMAQKIEDPAEQNEALLALIEELNYSIGAQESQDTAPENNVSEQAL